MAPSPQAQEGVQKGVVVRRRPSSSVVVVRRRPSSSVVVVRRRRRPSSSVVRRPSSVVSPVHVLCVQSAKGALQQCIAELRQKAGCLGLHVLQSALHVMPLSWWWIGQFKTRPSSLKPFCHFGMVVRVLGGSTRQSPGLVKSYTPLCGSCLSMRTSPKRGDSWRSVAWRSLAPERPMRSFELFHSDSGNMAFVREEPARAGAVQAWVLCAGGYGNSSPCHAGTRRLGRRVA